MKRSRILFLLGVLVAAFGVRANAQTTITQRTIPNPNGQTVATPAANLPLPASVAAQPAAVLPQNPDEMRRRIAAAVEDILSLYGNPPFAEVITNDQVRAAALRSQLALVGQAESLRTEIANLTATRDNLAAQVAAKERELAYFREQAATLQQTLAASLDRLTKIPQTPQPGPAAPSAGGSTGATNSPVK